MAVRVSGKYPRGNLCYLKCLKDHGFWVPPSLNDREWPRSTISNDDGVFNYFIKMTDYIVRTTRCLQVSEIGETFSMDGFSQ